MAASSRRRFLKRNKGTEAPSNLLFFDTESHEPIMDKNRRTRRLKMRLWCAIALRLEGGEVTRRQVAQGHTASELWDFIDSRCDESRPLWTFAHNLGFDLTLADFWKELWRLRYTVGPVERPFNETTGKQPPPWTGKLCVETRPQFLVVKGDRGVIKAVDTGNYWPTKLAVIGEAHGIAKGTMPDWKEPDAAWFAYCLRDCEVTEAAVVELLRWWVKERCGVFQLTAAQLSLKNFRHTAKSRTADGECVNIASNPDAECLDLERKSFYGGRFEAFYIGSVPFQVHQVDVNSMYPAMMAAHSFPRRQLGVCPEKTPAGLQRAMAAYGAVAAVKINSRWDCFPVKHDGNQFHVRGIYWTVLAGPELKRALDNGCVEKVGETQLYSLAPVFRDWVHTWYGRKLRAMRKGPKAAGELEFCKLILNSLYGKFAQTGRHWVERLDMGWQPEWEKWCEWDGEKEKPRWYRAVAGVAQELVEDDEPNHAFPAIAAYVTSYAREFMRNVREMVTPETIFYQGNDSFICDETCLRDLQRMKLMDESGLGMFRLVKSFDSAEFRGANNYRLGDTWTRAGRHGRAKPNLLGDLETDHFQSLPEILSAPPQGEVIVTTYPFKETHSTLKGKRRPDGWTRPFRITEDMDWTDHLPRSMGEGGKWRAAME